MADVASISYLLSSVASVARILESIRGFSKTGRPPTPDEFRKIAEQAEAEAARRAAAGDFKEPVLAKSMSEEIVEILNSKIDKISSTIKKIYSDETLSNDKKTKALNESIRNFCWYLQEMRKYHGGNLPPDLEKEWELNGCANLFLG